MAKFQIKRNNDEGGPYKWSHVVLKDDALCVANIYTKTGDELTEDQAAALAFMCKSNGHTIRLAP